MKDVVTGRKMFVYAQLYHILTSGHQHTHIHTLLRKVPCCWVVFLSWVPSSLPHNNFSYTWIQYEVTGVQIFKTKSEEPGPIQIALHKERLIGEWRLVRRRTRKGRKIRIFSEGNSLYRFNVTLRPFLIRRPLKSPLVIVFVQL